MTYGTVGWSSTVTVNVDSVTPDPVEIQYPSAIQASAVFTADGEEQNQLTAGWEAQYRFQWAASPDGTLESITPAVQTGEWTQWSTIPVTSADASFPTDGLKSVAIDCQVRLVNGEEINGPVAEDSTSASVTARLALQDAQNFHAVEVGADWVRLQWDPSPDPNVAGYAYHIEPDEMSTVDLGNVTETVVSGLQSATDYQFGLHVYDAAGNMNHTVYATAATAAAPASELTVYGEDTETVLIFHKSPTAACTGYDIEYWEDDDPGTVLTTTVAWPAGSSQNYAKFSVPGLTNGTAYSFKVKAKPLGSPSPSVSHPSEQGIIPCPFLKLKTYKALLFHHKACMKSYSKDEDTWHTILNADNDKWKMTNLRTRQEIGDVRKEIVECVSHCRAAPEILNDTTGGYDTIKCYDQLTKNHLKVEPEPDSEPESGYKSEKVKYPDCKWKIPELAPWNPNPITQLENRGLLTDSHRIEIGNACQKLTWWQLAEEPCEIVDDAKNEQCESDQRDYSGEDFPDHISYWSNPPDHEVKDTIQWIKNKEPDPWDGHTEKRVSITIDVCTVGDSTNKSYEGEYTSRCEYSGKADWRSLPPHDIKQFWNVQFGHVNDGVTGDPIGFNIKTCKPAPPFENHFDDPNGWKQPSGPNDEIGQYEFINTRPNDNEYYREMKKHGAEVTDIKFYEADGTTELTPGSSGYEIIMAEDEVETIRAKAFYEVPLDSGDVTYEVPLPVEITGGTGEAHLNDPHTLHAIKAGTIQISASVNNIDGDKVSEDEDGKPATPDHEETINGVVIRVDSILPNIGSGGVIGQEEDDGDGNSNTKTFVVSITNTSDVTVTAALVPPIPAADLPSDWTINGGAGTDKLQRTVSTASTSKTVFTFSCGGIDSGLETKIYVYEAKFALYSDDATVGDDFGHSWWEFYLDLTTKNDVFDTPKQWMITKGGYWPEDPDSITFHFPPNYTDDGEVLFYGEAAGGHIPTGQHEWHIRYEKLKDGIMAVDGHRKTPGTWHALSWNCTHVACAIAGAAGHPCSETNPSGLSDWLNALP